jgi:hypothetical protein
MIAGGAAGPVLFGELVDFAGQDRIPVDDQNARLFEYTHAGSHVGGAPCMPIREMAVGLNLIVVN